MANPELAALAEALAKDCIPEYLFGTSQNSLDFAADDPIYLPNAVINARTSLLLKRHFLLIKAVSIFQNRFPPPDAEMQKFFERRIDMYCDKLATNMRRIFASSPGMFTESEIEDAISVGRIAMVGPLMSSQCRIFDKPPSDKDVEALEDNLIHRMQDSKDLVQTLIKDSKELDKDAAARSAAGQIVSYCVMKFERLCTTDARYFITPFDMVPELVQIQNELNKADSEIRDKRYAG